MRRGNGDGTIYHRKDGRYEAAAYVRTNTGRSKRVRVYADSRAGARARLNELLVKVDRGITMPDRQWVLRDYLDHWLTTTVATTCRPRTVESYRSIVTKYIEPQLGGQRLASLRVTAVQQAIARLQEDGLSVRLLHEFRKVLGAALTQAQREELIDRNPARLLRLPHYEPRDAQPWTSDQLAVFLSAAANDPLYEAFVLLAVYGLRRSEVLGIAWGDVDRATGVIHIRRQVQRLSGSLQLTPLKTRAAARDLPIVPMVDVALGRLPHGQDDDLLFRTATGQPVEPHNLARSFRRIVATTDLPPITLHYVRHSAASLLARLRVPTRHAQQILGHANATTTQQIYQHADVEDQRAALLGIDSELTAAVNRGGSRQTQPSDMFLLATITTIQSGGPGGTRTHDTLLKRIPDLRENLYLPRLLLIVRDASKRTLLGAPAVSAAVSDADRHSNDQSFRMALCWYGLTRAIAEPLP